MRLRGPHPEGGVRPRLAAQASADGRLPKRGDDRGLTTLEWLLIVAAIAGLAALAVVLVTKVVSDTGDQVGSLSPRLAAARLQAHEIEVEASKLTPDDIPDRKTYNAMIRKYDHECERLGILYGDIDGIAIHFIAPPAPDWPQPGDSPQLKKDILRMNVEIGVQMGFGGDPPQGGCWMTVHGKVFTTCCKRFNPAIRDALVAECTRLNIFRRCEPNIQMGPRG
ncbi:MAG: hypothetical protein OXC06_11880 [Acidimicrobiaceae bacterium]|nr:hypothetical protein [Acidimicrobiaceae bacterium]